jgi:uncharacterized protein (DUF2141 family)
MKWNLYAQLALVIIWLCPAPALAEPHDLSVMVSGLSPASGTVEVSLFDSAESFLKEPYKQQSGPVDEAGRFATEFAALPEGEYAIVVVHDANDNGKLDNGFLGIGGERYGYSNGAGSWLGRPDFEDAKFRVDQPGAQVEIDLD